jgi:hypothetical protein
MLSSINASQKLPRRQIWQKSVKPFISYNN